jgi:hypothetical protein
MADGVDLAWGRLAIFAGGVLALAVVGRGVSAALGIAYNELCYRAGRPWVAG